MVVLLVGIELGNNGMRLKEIVVNGGGMIVGVVVVGS